MLVEQLRDLLAESVRLHLRSDVPLGAFLSGGLDSSAVVAMMTRLAPGAAVKTFSIGFAEDGFDESSHARDVAALFGTDHHALVLEPRAVDFLDDLTWFLDEPFGDPSAIPTYLVSRLAAEHVKVVLSGDGGDELFAGYERYLLEPREQRHDRWPAAVRGALGRVGGLLPPGARGRNFLRHLGFTGIDRYLHAHSLFDREAQAGLLQPDVFEAAWRQDPRAVALAVLATAGGTHLSALQQWDLESYLPLDILTKVDRMTMAHSIEARPPLLDHRIVEFAATVPSDLQIRGGTTKWLFKRAMRGLLPDHIIDRPKHGFAVPLSRWFRDEWSVVVRDVLLSPTCRRRGLFEPDHIESLLRQHASGRALDWQLWTLMSVELWCRMFLDAPVPRRAMASRPVDRRAPAPPSLAGVAAGDRQGESR